MSAAAAARARPYAIVTGSTRGLGEAIATLLCHEGFDVCGIGRAAAPNINESTFSVTHYQCDLSQPSKVEELFHSKLKSEIAGRSRVVLVNNAGTLGPVGPTSMFGALGDDGGDGFGSISQVDEAIRLNLTTPLWLSGAVVRAAGPTAIVRVINISSGAADNAYPGWKTYCASKAGLRMSGQVLAVDAGEFDELKERDVRVLDYAPGVVDTDMQVSVRTSAKKNFPRVEKFVGLHSSGKLLKAEESATPVVDFALSGKGEAYTQGRYGA